MIFKIIYIIFITGILSCSSKKNVEIPQPIQNTFSEDFRKIPINAINVKEYGVVANGIIDDRAAIQSTFQKNKTIYFPPGNYLIKSYSERNKFFYITDDIAPKELIFHKDAKLIISAEQNPKFPKAPLFFIDPVISDIDTIKFSGLNVEGNSQFHDFQNTAISAYVRKGKFVNNLIVENCHFRNMGNQGIHTKAKNTLINNLITENTTMHGVAASNKSDDSYKMYIYINNYTSINDKAYSIDLGKQKDMASRLQRTGFQWDAEIKNVKSINSKLGIKTAGAWDVKFENILIENSEFNGFYVNHDAPGHTIQMHKVKIINPGGNGLALSNKTNFNGQNIQIINAGGGALFIGEANANIDSLYIDGNHRSKYLMKFGNNNSIVSNFEIKNSADIDKYPIRIHSNNLELKNGVIRNISSKFPIIFHKNSKNVTLENITIQDKYGNVLPELNIMNIQENGNYNIIEKQQNSKFNYKIYNKGNPY